MSTEFKTVKVGGRFQNCSPTVESVTFKQFLEIMWAMWTKPRGVRPYAGTGDEKNVIPVNSFTGLELDAAPDMSAWRLGHSTVLMKLRHGRLFLTDPVFSERASPLSCAGPKRFSRLPIGLDEFCQMRAGSRPIEGIFISHDHYDHLDKDTIMLLKTITRHFFVPMGIKAILISWGVDADTITEMEWWDTVNFYDSDLQIVCTPAQHQSGRSLFGRNKTLWCSWSILQRLPGTTTNANEENSFRIFFSGDSGYSPHFKRIGEVIGPFDVTFVENGQYHEVYLVAHHMLPHQTAQAHADLRGSWLVPIHNLTFDLAFHMWWDPLDAVEEESEKLGLNLCTPELGERIDLLKMQPLARWWKPYRDSQLREISRDQETSESLRKKKD